MEQTLVEKYRPRTFEDFIGLKKVTARLQRFAAHPKSTAFIFVGPAGVGKTTMARAFADVLGYALIHVPSQTLTVDRVESIRRLVAYYPPEGKRGYLVLADEIDTCSKQAQYALLSMLDSSATLTLEFGGTSREAASEFPVVWIGTCNGDGENETRPPASLDRKFLSRCLPPFEFSAAEIKKELAAYLETIWLEEGGLGQPFEEVANEIAQESRGQVRDALQALELRLLDCDFEIEHQALEFSPATLAEVPLGLTVIPSQPLTLMGREYVFSGEFWK